MRAGHAYGFVSGLLTLSSLVVAASVCCGPTAAVGRAAWGPTRAIYYVASGMQPVIRVDPLTGNRIVAATPISGPSYLANAMLESPSCLLAVDGGFGYMYRIDFATTSVAMVSGMSQGTGWQLQHENCALAVENPSYALSGLSPPSSGLETLGRINLSTGDRTPLSGGAVGSGPTWSYRIWDVAVEPDGKILVLSNYPNRTAYRVDPADGSRTIATDFGIGLGLRPQLDIMSNGNIVCSMNDSVVLYEKASDTTRTLSGPTNGTGPLPTNGYGLAVGGDNEVYIFDLSLLALFKIDPVTGDRTILSRSSGTQIGSGPSFPAGGSCGVAVDKSSPTSARRWELFY